MRRIMVGVKRVVDYNVRIRVKPDNTGVITEGVKMSINPFDEIALEEALRIKEKGLADEVRGRQHRPGRHPAAAAHRARHGRRSRDPGADRRADGAAVDRARSSRRLPRPSSRSLVLLGKQAIDDDNNQTGADAGRPAGTGRRPCRARRSRSPTARPRVTREVDAGLETLEIDLPAVRHGRPAPERAALREAAGHHEGQEEAARHQEPWRDSASTEGAAFKTVKVEPPPTPPEGRHGQGRRRTGRRAEAEGVGLMSTDPDRRRTRRREAECQHGQERHLRGQDRRRLDRRAGARRPMARPWPPRPRRSPA